MGAVCWYFLLYPNNDWYGSSWTDYALPEAQLIEAGWLHFKHQGGSPIMTFEHDNWAGEIDFNLMMQLNSHTLKARSIRRILVDTS